MFPRIRSKTGVDELAAKAAFPTLALTYRDDWEDYARMQIPFVLERVVIADRGAAARAVTSESNQPVFSPPFDNFKASDHWWEPIRRLMLGSLRVTEERDRESSSLVKAQAAVKPVITYFSTQEKGTGPRLSESDHNALVEALKSFKKQSGFEVNVVPANARWSERMKLLVRSTVSI